MFVSDLIAVHKDRFQIQRFVQNHQIGGPSNLQDAHIQAHGLGGYFTDYEDPGRTGKPKGDNIRLVMERNGLKQPLYIGDTQGDWNAACQAGAPFLHAAYGFGRVPEHLPAVRDFAELPAAAEALSPP